MSKVKNTFATTANEKQTAKMADEFISNVFKYDTLTHALLSLRLNKSPDSIITALRVTSDEDDLKTKFIISAIEAGKVTDEILEETATGLEHFLTHMADKAMFELQSVLLMLKKEYVIFDLAKHGVTISFLPIYKKFARGEDKQEVNTYTAEVSIDTVDGDVALELLTHIPLQLTDIVLEAMKGTVFVVIDPETNKVVERVIVGDPDEKEFLEEDIDAHIESVAKSSIKNGRSFVGATSKEVTESGNKNKREETTGEGIAKNYVKPPRQN